MSLFNVTTPADPMYNEFKQGIEDLDSGNNRFNYASLVAAYNGAEVGSIIDFPWPKKKRTVLVDQLARRGLTDNFDFTLKCDAEEVEGDEDIEKAFLIRVTDKVGVEPKHKRRPLTDEEKDAAKTKRLKTMAANKKAAAAVEPPPPAPAKAPAKAPVKKASPSKKK